MCHPEIRKNNTIFGKKGTFLSNMTKGSIWLPDADFFWIIPGELLWKHFNTFVPNGVFLYPLKTSENRKVF